MRNTSRGVSSVALALIAVPAVAAGPARAAAPAPTGLAVSAPVAAEDVLDRELGRVVADYVGLYRREALSEWRKLFLPGFAAGSARPEGKIQLRTLEEFYEAQRKYLETGRAIKETLENVRLDRQGRLASAWADFVLEDEGERSRGRLVLTLLESEGTFKIHSLLFEYDRYR